MSRVSDTARIPHTIKRPIKFIDGYEWEVDQFDNHRLINRDLDTVSDWATFQGLAILNDRMVATDYWQGFLPTYLLLRWEVLPSPPPR